MKRILAILLTIFICATATAQMENSIVIDTKSFRAVQQDELTGVNIDPIGLDHSRQACARVKIKFDRMNKAQIDALEVKMRSNTDLTKQKVADYFENVLILEMTAKPNTRFYFYSPEFGESNEVTLNLEGNREYEMLASLNQTFSIVVSSNAENVDIYLDDVFKGKTDGSKSLTIKEVMIGAHTLKAVYGTVSSQQSIEVNSGSILFRQDVNTAANKPQYVVFTVEPKSSAVTIDGQLYVAEDGVVVALLQNGQHSYKAEARGYHSQSGTITVAGAKIERTITLKGDFATVTLTADSGADIYVNDKKVGTTTWSGRLNSGLYIFEARKSGYRTQSLTRQITSDPASQSYTLPALAPIYGSADITSSPAMADITLDGKTVGRTPLQLDNLLVGEHKITVSKSGYQPYTTTVIVAEGGTATISATLKKGFDFGDIEMVFVQGGTFTMGATSGDADEKHKPAHSVTLSDYYIGKYEVTQAQWRAVMGDNPSHFQGDNLPVDNVSWDDIQLFLRKLNAKTGKNFRLPTEAEWEYAARGGNQSKGYKYSGSNTLGDVAWYRDNSGSKTHPVGQKQPNELGVYDMSGNICEWCSDWYGSYSSSPQSNPKGPNSGTYRVQRGGAGWFFLAKCCRVSHRGNGPPDHRDELYGFRLACSPDLNTPMSTAVASTTKTYKVGDYYNDGVKEGVVFEVSADGRHGKIVSMKQSAEKLQWSSDSAEQKRLIGANSETDGAYNMAKVKAIYGWQSKYPAFKWCADLGEGWFLPSKEELKVFTLNTAIHDAVNRTLIARGGTKLYGKGESGWYWSSTERDYKSSGEFYAWLVNMYNGYASYHYKSINYYVRAVSAF
ncbi:MAG: SUMF1/EgtB/PvdO family nonheme iron enzyme [Alistipes sp.]|nr:SUMF1/EgtB/PvdO family nonheme iron enzyme [Alistipes sp.]